MSGLRVYLHDWRGREISGVTHVRVSRRGRWCEGYQHPVWIRAGEHYAIATTYPGDEFFSYVDRDTLQPLRRPVRMNLCMDCAGRDVRELLEAHLVGLAAKPQRCQRCWQQIASRLDVMARNGKRYCAPCMDELEEGRYNLEHYG